MRKIKHFLSMDLLTKRLLIEAFFYLGIARIMKKYPFSKVAPALGVYMDETSQEAPVQKELLVKISNAIHIMSKYTFWESQCLVKGIAAMKMLERRGIESTLYLGTKKDTDGKLIAHAWLRNGNYVITGFDGMEGFTVVSTFAKITRNASQETMYEKDR